MVRSMKNNFAPISRIPSEIFSLIPGYWEGGDVDENLITMTHVCRGWRDLLIARPSLWTRLDCTNTDKTRIYIERSKSSPLELSLCKHQITYPEDAFLLVVPHISRLKSLSVDGAGDLLQDLTPYFSCPIPLLEELTIDLTGNPTPVLEGTLFDSDLSSLCSLSLLGVTTYLPWKGLSKLTTLKLCHVPEDTISVAHLLDFFEDAYHLRDITLNHSLPTSSNAPPERLVSLPCLTNLTICANPVHSILLNHLSIPAGASLILEFRFNGNKSPLPDFLPKTLGNLKNIFPITSVNLWFDEAHKHVRLDGPNGRLYMLGHWADWDWDDDSLFVSDRRILRSLSNFAISGTQRLAVTKYEPPAVVIEKSSPYHILLRMKDLRTLTLTQSNNLPFILALNPDKNPSENTLCPTLEEIVLYVEELESFNIKELMSMAKARASRGTRLSSITIVGLGALLPGEKVFKLKEHVTRVDYRVREKPLKWDSIAKDGDD